MDDRRERLIRAGEWLRNQRERRGMSVRELAAELGVTTQVVYDWQNGKNAVSDDRADDIAKALNLGIFETREGLRLWVPDDERPNLDRLDPRVGEVRELLDEANRILAEIIQSQRDQEPSEEPPGEEPSRKASD